MNEYIFQVNIRVKVKSLMTAEEAAGKLEQDADYKIGNVDGVDVISTEWQATTSQSD
jgi:hypothetical protein